MLNSLRRRYRRSMSVNECDLRPQKPDVHGKSIFSLFSRKSSFQRVSSAYSTQRVHSEPTRRKFGSGLQLSRSKSNSVKRKCSYETLSSSESTKSLGSQDLDFVENDSDQLPVNGPDSRDEINSNSTPSSPGSPRRLAICAELEKDTFMENGESLLTGHKNLVVRDYLENYAYI